MRKQEGADIDDPECEACRSKYHLVLFNKTNRAIQSFFACFDQDLMNEFHLFQSSTYNFLEKEY